MCTKSERFKLILHSVQVTIAAKGMSGGHTAFIPKGDEYHVCKDQLVAQMDVSMGGRAAEELVFGKDKITGGASSDLEIATGISNLMVKSLGMSEKAGLRVYPSNGTSPHTNEIVDSEVNRMLNESYARAKSLLKAHRFV